MFKNLNPIEDTVTTQITVTNGFHDGGVGTIAGSSFTTASLSAAQKIIIIMYNIIQRIILVFLMGILVEVVVLNNQHPQRVLLKPFINNFITSQNQLRLI